MHHVYKITHLESGKYYIGVHKTSKANDSYMGSGPAIKAAVRKHGRQAFRKEILSSFESKDDAYDEEKRLTESLRFGLDTYNLKPGGIGGWSIDAQAKGVQASVKAKAYLKASQKCRELDLMFGGPARMIENCKRNGFATGKANAGKPKSELHKQNISASLTGRNHSEATKEKMSRSRKGRVFSDEHRKKISEAAKARHASKNAPVG